MPCRLRSRATAWQSRALEIEFTKSGFGRGVSVKMLRLGDAELR